MQSLQLQPGNRNSTTYEDRFSKLGSQFRGLKPTHLIYMFLMALPLTTNRMCFCMVQPHLRKCRIPVAAGIWRPGLHSTPAHQRWPPPNVIADHTIGISPRPVPVATDLEQHLPANGVVFAIELVPKFADAHRSLRDPMTPAPVPNRGESPRAARLRGFVSTVANQATLQRKAERRETRYTSTCPVLLLPQPRKAGPPWPRTRTWPWL